MPKNMTLDEFEKLTEEDFDKLPPEERDRYNTLVDKELRKWSYKDTAAKDDAVYKEAFEDLFKSASGGRG